MRKDCRLPFAMNSQIIMSGSSLMHTPYRGTTRSWLRPAIVLEGGEGEGCEREDSKRIVK